MITVSVCVVMLNGSLTFESAAIRVAVRVPITPAGVVTFTLDDRRLHPEPGVALLGVVGDRAVGRGDAAAAVLAIQ